MTVSSTLSARHVAPQEASGTDAGIPLVVDVDGTLIKSDLLFESALQMAARRPFQLWRIALWLAKGKAALKTSLADFGDPSIGNVPLREEIVELIRLAQRQGRPVYLASASDRRLVEQLAHRLGGISGVFATDGPVNLAGIAKAECLTAHFGRGKFDYVGDANVDFPVWQCARRVLALTHGASFEQRLLRAFPDADIVARPRPQVHDYVRALRPHQWAKNALIFLPLIAGHFLAPGHLIAAVIAFVSFSMAASSAYLINDLLDLPGDREHPRKRERPIAAGNVSAKHAVALAALLALCALGAAFPLPVEFVVVLSVYWIATLGYSVVLKRKIVVDVVMLGSLYTLRVLAGVAAIGTTTSEWLLMFCLFLFLALAIVKRCSELIARQRAGLGAPAGRGYRFEDLRALFAFGAAAGYGAVLVVTLYLASPDVRALYDHPDRLWLICPVLLYWVTRMFMLSNRGDLHDDPLVFALTDRISWASGACIVAVLAAAV